MHFLNPEYLQTLKKNRNSEQPSKTLILALKELKSINQKQSQQIKQLKAQTSELKSQNQHLNECLKKISSDYEQYKSHKRNRQNKNTKNQVELIKRIQQLQFLNQKLNIEVDSYRAIADISTSRSHLTTKTFIPEPISQRPSIPRIFTTQSITLNDPISKQIQQFQLSNQLLTKRILEVNLEEASFIRSEMRNNNKEIAKLKSSLNKL